MTEDGLLRIEGWARDGLTDEQIAYNIGINVKTLWDWKTKYDPICNALKKGKAPVDVEVENALLKSALGFYVTLKKPVKTKTVRRKADGSMVEEEHIEYAEEQQYISPQTTAQIFWLKNRRPDRWRDKAFVENTITGEKVEDDPITKSLREMAEQLRQSQ